VIFFIAPKGIMVPSVPFYAQTRASGRYTTPVWWTPYPRVGRRCKWTFSHSPFFPAPNDRLKEKCRSSAVRGFNSSRRLERASTLASTLRPFLDEENCFGATKTRFLCNPLISASDSRGQLLIIQRLRRFGRRGPKARELLCFPLLHF